jgi:hypothetical protein
VGSAICGGAQSSNMLIIGRAVAGIGGAGIGNGGIIIISAAVPLQKRPGTSTLHLSCVGNARANTGPHSLYQLNHVDGVHRTGHRAIDWRRFDRKELLALV